MAILDGFDTFFDFIADQAADEALVRDLPIVGAAVGNAAQAGLALFDEIRTAINTALAGVPSNSAEAIAQALTLAAIPGVTATAVGGLVNIRLQTGDTTAIDLPDAGVDAGSDALGLNIQAAFDASIVSALNVLLVYDTATDSLDLGDAGTEELTLGLNLFVDLAADADLGPVGFTVTDLQDGATPEVALAFGLNFNSLDAADIDVTVGGAVNLGLGLATETSIDILPTFFADLILSWNFDTANDAPEPVIRFDNVGVDLGSLVDVIADAISPITDIFGRRPFRDIIAAITTPLPIIDDGLGALGIKGLFDVVPATPDDVINALDLAGNYYRSQGDTASADRLNTFALALSVIKQLTELQDQAGGLGRLNLGQFDFANEGAASFDFEGLTPDAFAAALQDRLDQVLGDNNVFSDAVGAIAGVIDEVTDSALNQGGLGGTQGFALPLLDRPQDVIKIFLPGLFPDPTVTFVEYDIPDLNVDFEFYTFFRLLGPIGISLEGEFEAGIDFTVGYDSQGIISGEFVDGFFIRTQELGENDVIPHRFQGTPGLNRIGPDGQVLEHFPIAYLYGEIRAGVGVDVVIFRAGVTGGIIGSAYAFLPDGQLRLDNFEQACIFDPIEGRITADLSVKIKVGIGFFSYSKTYVLAEATLVDFSYGCTASGTDIEIGMGLATFNQPGPASLRLNAGLFAGQRSINGIVGTDTNESFRVRNAVDADNVAIAGALGVSAFGFEDVYGSAATPPTRIVALMGAGDDTVFLDAAVAQGADADGGAGDDFLSGGLGDDNFQGGEGQDTLNGGGGADRLLGGEGEDTFDGGAGADLINGNGGRDQISYERSAAGVVFDGVGQLLGIDGVFTAEIGFRGRGGDAEGDLLASVEDITGSNFDDEIRGNPTGANTIAGLAGNDSLYGGSGRDFLLGGVGADYLNGRGGDDATSYIGSLGAVFVDLGSGAAFGGEAQGDFLVSIEGVQGSGYDDVLRGSASADLLGGWYGDDILEGRGGADIVDGTDGNDIVLGGADGDRLDGGFGIDLLTYAHLSTPIVMNLRTGEGNFFLNQDRIGTVDPAGNFFQFIERSSFENLDGGQSSDVITGDLFNNRLRGLAGADTVDGEAGNDVIVGGTGADTLRGGVGLDLGDYSDGFGVTVNLALGTGLRSVAEGDTLTGIEDLLGSFGDDVLTGDDLSNRINPGLSTTLNRDIVEGGGGIDTLVVDYSVGDTGRGISGGFFPNSIDAGSFDRRANDFTVIDRVDFTGVERLNLIGTIRDDFVTARGGDDIIATGGGNDTINAGFGNDRVYADSGDDSVRSGVDSNGNLINGTSQTGFVDLDGGRGIDRLSISLAGQTGNLNLLFGAPGVEFKGANLRLPNGGAVRNFEIVEDLITGFGDDRVIQPGDVDNDFRTGGGVDVIRPGLGRDQIDGGFDFKSDREIVLEGGTGNDVGRFVIGDDATFLANAGDLLVVDYSSVTEGPGLTVYVSAVRSNFDLYDRDDSGRLSYNPLYTNEGGFDLGPEIPDVGSSIEVRFREIERLDVTGSPLDDEIEGTHNVWGATGNDAPQTQPGYLSPARGGDVLRGGAGNDVINGNTGNDVILGGAGNDRLQGTWNRSDSASTSDPSEIDRLSGGSGADAFIIATGFGSFYTAQPLANPFATDNRAIITDFDPLQGDTIELFSRSPNYRSEQSGADTLIYFTSSSFGDQLVAQVLNFSGFDLDGDYVVYRLGAADTVTEDGGSAVQRTAPAPVSPLQDAQAPAAAPPTSKTGPSGFTVNQNNDATALASALFGGAGSGIDPASVTASLTGDGRAFGTFSVDPFGLGSGIVLSTGQVEDLVGPNTIDGGTSAGLARTLTFEKVGTFNGSGIYRANLSGLGIDLNSITLKDGGTAMGGSGGSASGFDIDGIAFSTVRLDSVTNATDLNAAGVLPRLDVIDFSAAGLVFTPGTQRPETNPAFPVSLDTRGSVNGLVDNANATLGVFDFVGGGAPGYLTLGDDGSLGLNFTSTLPSDGPLYLYVAEAGDNDPQLAGEISVSSGRIDAPTDLSTDFGLPGVANDTISFTYNFSVLPGQDVDSVFFEFVLFSEELIEFAGSDFNDSFKIKLNGVNLAQLSDGSAAVVNNLRSSPMGPSSPDLILNRVLDGPARTITPADSYTKMLSFSGPLAAGVNTVTIEVADVRDGLLDSGILVKGGTFRAGNAPLSATSVVARDDNRFTNENLTITGSVLENDNGPTPADLPVVAMIGFGGEMEMPGSTIAGRYGTLTLNADGSYTYVADGTPSDALPFDVSGVDVFSYMISVGGVTDLAQLTITVTGGDDVIVGTSGFDSLTGGQGAATPPGLADPAAIAGRNEDIGGEAGDDIISAGGGDDRVFGGAGADNLSGGTGGDLVEGNDGADLLKGDAGADALIGGADADEVRGGAGGDYLRGDGGDDRVFGDADGDELHGGDGVDALDGGDGNDIIVGEAGADAIAGGDGADYGGGGEGVDTLDGGAGGDVLFGGGDADVLSGGAGLDILVGEAGADKLLGGADADWLTGGDGADLAAGEAGDDSVYGDGGDDRLAGQLGDDFLFGGAGNDTIAGGLGADYMDGGAGADTFLFASAADSRGSTNDLIAGFETGLDRLDLTALRTGAADRLIIDRYDNSSVVIVDQGGDGDADFFVIVLAPVATTDVVFTI